MVLIKTKTLKLAFIDIGWIGKNIMKDILKIGLVVPGIILDEITDLLLKQANNILLTLLQTEFLKTAEVHDIINRRI